MTIQDAAVAVIAALDELAIPYMLVGSLSSSLYGIPRSTKDVDFVVELGPRRAADVGRALGPDFRIETQMSFETITMTSRTVIHLVGSELTVELFQLSDDPHDQERFRRRRQITMFDRQAWVPTAEDVVVMKVRWASTGRRPKDVTDARDVIAVRGGELDWAYIESWCDQHGSRAQLDDIRRSIPPA